MGYPGLQRFILFTKENLTYNVMKCCLLIAIFVMFPDMFPGLFPSPPQHLLFMTSSHVRLSHCLKDKTRQGDTDDIADR